MAGEFDDLIPKKATPVATGAFDDLIPKKASKSENLGFAGSLLDLVTQGKAGLRSGALTGLGIGQVIPKPGPSDQASNMIRADLADKGYSPAEVAAFLSGNRRAIPNPGYAKGQAVYDPLGDLVGNLINVSNAEEADPRTRQEALGGYLSAQSRAANLPGEALGSAMATATDLIGQAALGEQPGWFKEAPVTDTGKKIQGHVAGFTSLLLPGVPQLAAAQQLTEVSQNPDQAWQAIKQSYGAAFDPKADLVDRVASGFQWAATLVGLGYGAGKGKAAFDRTRFIKEFATDGVTPEVAGKVWDTTQQYGRAISAAKGPAKGAAQNFKNLFNYEGARTIAKGVIEKGREIGYFAKESPDFDFAGVGQTVGTKAKAGALAKQPPKGYAVNETGQVMKAPALESTTLGNRAYTAPVVTPEAGPKNFQTVKGEVAKPIPDGTLYMKPKEIERLRSLQTADTTLIDLGDGRIGFRYTGGPNAGKKDANSFVSPSVDPMKGTVAVEVRDGRLVESLPDPKAETAPANRFQDLIPASAEVPKASPSRSVSDLATEGRSRLGELQDERNRLEAEKADAVKKDPVWDIHYDKLLREIDRKISETQKQYPKTYFRQADSAEFLSRDLGMPGKFYADSPDLALGQGDNKNGVLFEVAFKEPGAVLEHAKPGTQVPGAPKEYKVGQEFAPIGRVDYEVVSITVPKGAKLDPATKVNLDTFSREGSSNQIYKRVRQEDGSTKYVLLKKGNSLKSAAIEPEAPKPTKQLPAGYTTDETGKVVKATTAPTSPAQKPKVPNPEGFKGKRGVAKDGTVFLGPGMINKALRHDAHMSRIGKTIMTSEGPEKVLDVKYDPETQVYSYTVQGTTDKQPRTHSNIYWQTNPPRILKESAGSDAMRVDRATVGPTPVKSMKPEEFTQRIDHIRKIAKGGGANVFKDLKQEGVAGLYEHPTDKFRKGRIRLDEGLSDEDLADALAHEVGHQIDNHLSAKVKPIDKPSGDFRVLFDVDQTTADTIKKELIEVTRHMVGDQMYQAHKPYFSKDKELYARFMQSAMFRPELIEKHAPIAYKHLQKMAEKHPMVADYLTIAQGGMIERAPGLMFLKDQRQAYIRTYGHYMGTRAYGNLQIYRARRAKWVKDVDDLIKTKFKSVKDAPQKLFDVAEGVRETDNGKPVFGTRIREAVPKSSANYDDMVKGLKDQGFHKVGETETHALFAKWRHSPAEAEAMYKELSPQGQKLIRDYTEAKEEPKDLFNREKIKEVFKIDSELEGWVHHFWKDKPNTRWAKVSLRERKAGTRKQRLEKEGFVKDFQSATAKALSDLGIEREWNDLATKQLALLAEPLNPGELPNDGWVAVEGDLLHGLRKVGEQKEFIVKPEGGKVQIRRGKVYQVPKEIYERFVQGGPFEQEISGFVKAVNSLNKYWQGNILVNVGTAGTNIISGALQYALLGMTDFYKDLLTLDPTFKRTRANMMGFLETMTPSGWRNAPDWIYGGEDNTLFNEIFGQRSSGGILDRAIGKMLEPYQNVERFFKKAIVNAEVRKGGGKAVLRDPEFIKAVNDVIDLFAYDYKNIPDGLERLKRNAIGAGFKPFMTYPYKYLKMLTNMMGGAFDRNLSMADRLAKFLAIGTFVTLYGLWKASRRKAMDEWAVGLEPGTDEEEAKLKSVVNARGRLYVGTDANGKAVYVRTAKYPVMNGYDALESLFHGDTQGFQDIVADQIGSVGPLGKLALNNVGKYRGEFDTYKSLGTLNAETISSYIPLGRLLKGVAEVIDPKQRNLPKDWRQVFGQYVPTWSAEWRDKLAGPEATVKVPLRADEKKLLAQHSSTKAIELVRSRLGDDAAERFKKALAERKKKGTGGAIQTLTLPVPKLREDILSREIAGVIFKRVDREWYERFLARRREVDAQQAKRESKQ